MNHYDKDREGSFFTKPELKDTVAGKVADANVLHFNLSRNDPAYDPETAYMLEEGKSRGYLERTSPIERFIESQVTNGLGYRDAFSHPVSSSVSTTDNLLNVLHCMDIKTGNNDWVADFSDAYMEALTIPEGPDREYVMETIPDRIKKLGELHLKIDELLFRAGE